MEWSKTFNELTGIKKSTIKPLLEYTEYCPPPQPKLKVLWIVTKWSISGQRFLVLSIDILDSLCPCYNAILRTPSPQSFAKETDPRWGEGIQLSFQYSVQPDQTWGLRKWASAKFGA